MATYRIEDFVVNTKRERLGIDNYLTTWVFIPELDFRPNDTPCRCKVITGTTRHYKEEEKKMKEHLEINTFSFVFFDYNQLNKFTKILNTHIRNNKDLDIYKKYIEIIQYEPIFTKFNENEFIIGKNI